jgi:hypothetical protein
MENENRNRGSQIKIITQKTSTEILKKTIEQDKGYLLSDSLEETLLMFVEVRKVWVKCGSLDKTVSTLQKAPYNLSQRTAFDYASKCPELFACIPRATMREFLVDIHLEKIENTYRTAEAMSDAKAMAAADKNRATAIEKFLGTNRAIDKELLRLPDVIAGFHPEWFPEIPPIDSAEFRKIKQLYTSKKERQRKVELEAEDIDFEDVT